MRNHRDDAREHAWAYGLSLCVLLAMLSPVLRCEPVDGFPLTTYPMYSGAMGTTSRVRTLLGITASGEQELLSPALIAGDPSVILAVRTTTGASSPERRRALCTTVAGRVAADPDLRDRYVEVLFLTERYDAEAYFLGADMPEAIKIHARCPVPR